jgi:hypothetical protein
MVGSATDASEALVKEGKAKSSNASQGPKKTRLQDMVESSLTSSVVKVHSAISL